MPTSRPTPAGTAARLVQAGDELGAPHERAPQRLHPRPVGADHVAFGRRAEPDHRDARRHRRRTARPAPARAGPGRWRVRTAPAGTGRRWRRAATRAGWPGRTRRTAGAPPAGAAGGTSRASENEPLLCRTRQVHGRRAQPRGALRDAGGRGGSGADADQASCRRAPRRPARTRRCRRTPGCPPRWAGTPPGRWRTSAAPTLAMSATKLSCPRVEQVRVEVRGGGDLGAAADARRRAAAATGTGVQGRVERVGEHQAELEQLVRDPLAHAEPGARRVDADRDVRQHEALADGDHQRRRSARRPGLAGSVAISPASTPQVSSAHHTSTTLGTIIAIAPSSRPTRPTAAASDVLHGRQPGSGPVGSRACSSTVPASAVRRRRRRTGPARRRAARTRPGRARTARRGRRPRRPTRPGSSTAFAPTNARGADRDRRDDHPAVLDTATAAARRRSPMEASSPISISVGRLIALVAMVVRLPDAGAEQPQVRRHQRGAAEHRQRPDREQQVQRPDPQVRRAPQPVPAGPDARGERPGEQDRQHPAHVR